MTTLILPPRYTEDSIALWRAAGELGWSTSRLRGWRVDSEISDDVVVYGEPLFAATVAQQLELDLLEAPFDWLTRLPHELLRRDVQFAELRDAPAQSFPRFLKPADDKSFPAAVYASAKSIPGLEHLPGSIPILSSSPVRWLREYRAFIADGALHTLSLYLRDGELDVHGTAEEIAEASAFVRSILPSISVAPAMVLDVGVIDGAGWAIVEANPCWGAGIYSCDPLAVLGVLKRACQPHATISSSDAQWVARREEAHW